MFSRPKHRPPKQTLPKTTWTIGIDAASDADNPPKSAVDCGLWTIRIHNPSVDDPELNMLHFY